MDFAHHLRTGWGGGKYYDGKDLSAALAHLENLNKALDAVYGDGSNTEESGTWYAVLDVNVTEDNLAEVTKLCVDAEGLVLPWVVLHLEEHMFCGGGMWAGGERFNLRLEG